MDDHRPAIVLAVTPFTARRLAEAEAHRRALEHLADEVSTHRPALLRSPAPATWQSDAASQYRRRLDDLHDWFGQGADHIDQARDALDVRIAAMRRALSAAAAAQQVGSPGP
ncbi:hypothetical protein ACDF64_04545 [Agromyces sp. MMS24-JH15]|uniref:hypothetical protein n=1 Tax=Agromyces sp. MMS24-JH15 TaxID=3243765 RepID=UPI00374921E8